MKILCLSFCLLNFLFTTIQFIQTKKRIMNLFGMLAKNIFFSQEEPTYCSLSNLFGKLLKAALNYPPQLFSSNLTEEVDESVSVMLLSANVGESSLYIADLWRSWFRQKFHIALLCSLYICWRTLIAFTLSNIPTKHYFFLLIGLLSLTIYNIYWHSINIYRLNVWKAISSFIFWFYVAQMAIISFLTCFIIVVFLYHHNNKPSENIVRHHEIMLNMA
jgi:hypothetical protein